MVLITGREIIDILVMVAGVTFIFKDTFKPPAPRDYDPLAAITNNSWENIKFTALVVGPAVVFHELGHKIVAVSMGLNATVHASYLFLGIGLVLKLLSFPFIFFVPGYVTYPLTTGLTPIMQSLIAFAGPGINLLLFLGSMYMIPRVKTDKMRSGLILTKQINMFLFIFNMIPLGIFDGATVVRGLIATFI